MQTAPQQDVQAIVPVERDGAGQRVGAVRVLVFADDLGHVFGRRGGHGGQHRAQRHRIGVKAGVPFVPVEQRASHAGPAYSKLWIGSKREFSAMAACNAASSRLTSSTAT
jgi:hypothetical protein